MSDRYAHNVRHQRPAAVPRRGFLEMVSGGLLAASASLTRARADETSSQSDNLPPNTPEWMKDPGDADYKGYGQPSKFANSIKRIEAKGRPSPLSSFSFTPLQDLRGIITPNGLFYERDHGGIPTINPNEHRLLIHGMVEQPLLLTIDDLMRFPSVSRIHFLECSGNSSAEWTKPTNSIQTSYGLLSCSEWTGVLLSTLLDAVGVKPGAKWILAEGADAAGMDRSVPMQKAMDDALIVYAQNGEPLRPEQGYPVRLLLPGFEGNMSVKWLRRIKVGAQPWMTREETSQYTDLMPDGTARMFTFVMDAKSVITHPAPGGKSIRPGTNEISGLAWSGHGKISRVDASVDGGRSWTTATLDTPVLSRCLTRFRLPWSWDGKPVALASRAIDETNYVQPTRGQLIKARGTHSRYHYNAIALWNIGADGTASNAYA
jgi:sulfane dehydrogenase subunit SoxC